MHKQAECCINCTLLSVLQKSLEKRGEKTLLKSKKGIFRELQFCFGEFQLDVFLRSREPYP